MVFLCTLTTLEQKGQQIRPLSCGNGILCNDTHHICTCSPYWQTAATRSIRSLLRNIITHTTKSTSITVEKLVEKKKLMLNKPRSEMGSKNDKIEENRDKLLSNFFISRNLKRFLSDIRYFNLHFLTLLRIQK